MAEELVRMLGMTRQQFIVLVVGFLFCFCLLGKQAALDVNLVADLPSIQDVVDENADSDELLDSGDHWLLMPFVFVATLLFFVVPVVTSLRYSQPIISSPQRPPSI